MDKSLISRPKKRNSRQLYFQLRLDCVFRFTLRFHLLVPCLVPFKVSPQRNAKKFLAVRTSNRKEVVALLSCNRKEVVALLSCNRKEIVVLLSCNRKEVHAVSRTQAQATRNQPHCITKSNCIKTSLSHSVSSPVLFFYCIFNINLNSFACQQIMLSFFFFLASSSQTLLP